MTYYPITQYATYIMAAYGLGFVILGLLIIDTYRLLKKWEDKQD